MDNKINIPEILKDKPIGTHLYSPTLGEVTLNRVCMDAEYPIVVLDKDAGLWEFDQYGRIAEHGECMLFPSKEMRDWSKFIWKKGDVLTDNSTTICIFDSWANDDYTEFNAVYTLHLIASYNAESDVCKTNDFVSVIKDEDKLSYLATAETYFNANLAKGSLKIDKPQFKDGDILSFDGRFIKRDILIFERVENNILYTKILLQGSGELIPCKYDFYINLKWSIENGYIRPATEEEKQQLFSALEMNGKAWDAEKKAIVDLPKKCEFKPKDWCLMREKGKIWDLCQFAYSKSTFKYNYYKAVGGTVFNECLPYNEQTAHLLGTTDDWKGGEK